jgi:hypothetical protein
MLAFLPALAVSGLLQLLAPNTTSITTRISSTFSLTLHGKDVYSWLHGTKILVYMSVQCELFQKCRNMQEISGNSPNQAISDEMMGTKMNQNEPE